MMINETLSAPAPTSNCVILPIWRDGQREEPPKDGAPIVIMGRLVYGRSVERVLATVFWRVWPKTGRGGWAYHHSGCGHEVSVLRWNKDRLEIDFWSPMPGEAKIDWAEAAKLPEVS